MFVVVVALLLVLVLGYVMFTDALDDAGSMTTKRGIKDIFAQIRRSASFPDQR